MQHGRRRAARVVIDHDGSQLAGLMRKHYIRLLTLGWDDGVETVGVDGAFDLEMESAQQALADRGKLIRNVADTTRDDVRRLTGQAAELGWSPAELERQIRALGEIASATRAALIGRTEAAAMYSKGSLIAYAESGQVSGTEWLLGPNPCEICQGIVQANPTVDLGKEFAGGIECPPAHPNCTCALAPLLTAA